MDPLLAVAIVIFGIIVMAGVVFVFMKKYDLEEYKFETQTREAQLIRKLEQERYEAGVARNNDALDQVSALKIRVESIETKISFAMQELNKGRRI